MFTIDAQTKLVHRTRVTPDEGGNIAGNHYRLVVRAHRKRCYFKAGCSRRKNDVQNWRSWAVLLQFQCRSFFVKGTNELEELNPLRIALGMKGGGAGTPRTCGSDNSIVDDPSLLPLFHPHFYASTPSRLVVLDFVVWQVFYERWRTTGPVRNPAKWSGWPPCCPKRTFWPIDLTPISS